MTTPGHHIELHTSESERKSLITSAKLKVPHVRGPGAAFKRVLAGSSRCQRADPGSVKGGGGAGNPNSSMPQKKKNRPKRGGGPRPIRPPPPPWIRHWFFVFFCFFLLSRAIWALYSSSLIQNGKKKHSPSNWGRGATPLNYCRFLTFNCIAYVVDDGGWCLWMIMAGTN